jgi:hypothetical protein
MHLKKATDNHHQIRRKAMNIENIRTIDQIEGAIEEQKEESGIRKTEIFFGLIMAVAALSGIWGAVSLLISWFLAT